MPDTVLEVLAAAQDQGFIGPGPLDPHVEHSIGFARAIERARTAAPSSEDCIVDLGPGGGLPGLVLAARWPATPFRFVEGSTRRVAFLRRALRRCGMEGQVEVVGMRAELAGRVEGLRGQHPVVVARSFGSPGTTAECASPLLRLGGLLVVSEPPKSTAMARWDPEGLDLLGLVRIAGSERDAAFAVFRQMKPCPEGFPRRVGVPGKRPLF